MGICKLQYILNILVIRNKGGIKEQVFKSYPPDPSWNGNYFCAAFSS